MALGKLLNNFFDASDKLGYILCSFSSTVSVLNESDCDAMLSFNSDIN